ncbi:MAG: hypothetical protein PHD46_05260, partial [Eubacteriales bacterium]|nr:hypothetical protein [Eubacteriales bacterium]
MFNREFHIKKNAGAFILKGTFSLIMAIIALACCLIAKLSYISSEYLTYIIIAGLLGCGYFFFLYTMTVISALKPLDALVLTEKGIYDFVTYPEKGLFIDWENVSSVRFIGTDKSPLLGIELYDADIIIDSLKKTSGEEIRANIESGLPPIIIKQSDIGVSISKIIPAFNDFINATRPIPGSVSGSGLNSYTSTDCFPAIAEDTDEISVISGRVAYVEEDDSDEEILILPPEAPAKDFEDEPPKRNMKNKEEEIFVLPTKPVKDIKKGSFTFTKEKDKTDFDIDEEAVPLFSEFVLEKTKDIKSDESGKTIDKEKI